MWGRGKSLFLLSSKHPHFPSIFFSPYPTYGLLGMERVRYMKRWRMGTVDCSGLLWQTPSEVAWGRIISFLLMSSTSWKGGEAITLLLFPPAPQTTTAARRIRILYIALETSDTTASPLLISLALSFFLEYTLGSVCQKGQTSCCERFLRDEQSEQRLTRPCHDHLDWNAME